MQFLLFILLPLYFKVWAEPTPALPARSLYIIAWLQASVNVLNISVGRTRRYVHLFSIQQPPPFHWYLWQCGSHTNSELLSNFRHLLLIRCDDTEMRDAFLWTKWFQGILFTFLRNVVHLIQVIVFLWAQIKMYKTKYKCNSFGFRTAKTSCFNQLWVG